MKNFDPSFFIADLNNKLSEFETSLINKQNFDSIFNRFLQIIQSTINMHAPLSTASRKQRKILSKPWLTKEF